ncbi:MAG TPA: TRAP transporter substrate-binding protein DctP [Polyangia bacterium]|nr:TRAP transporter substrate-binding protein DctP [Polyangia bacterium]
MRLALCLLLASSVALADETTTLRIGTIVPEGTGWARGLHEMERDLDAETHGALKLKFYMGGIAGDEVEMLQRVHRGQLDAIMSGSVACETTAPSMRVVRIPGVFQTWPETSYVLGRLRPLFEDEAKKNGFTYLGEAIVGPSILFSRTPIRDLSDLSHQRLWIWDIDRMLGATLAEMHLPVMQLPIRDALRAYEEGRTDGFIAPAVVALAFQWSAAAHYFTDLRLGFVVGCLVVANRAFDALPLSSQQALRVVSAHTKSRIEEIGRMQEDQLLHGLFAKQGLKPVATDESVRVAFFEDARAAREKSATRLVSGSLIARVLGMLADFRSEHRVP